MSTLLSPSGRLISLTLSALLTGTGVGGNLFIIICNIMKRADNQKAQLGNALITWITVCCLAMDVSSFLLHFFVFRLHFCPFTSNEIKIITFVVFITSNWEFWLIASLCIFYCLTVVTFKSKLLIVAKQNISALIWCGVVLGFVISLLEAFLVTRMTAKSGNDTSTIPMASNFSCPQVYMPQIEKIFLNGTLSIQFLVTTSLMISACGVLSYCLRGHVRHLEQSSFGLTASSQENLTRITKMISALALEFIVSTTCVTIPNIFSQYTEISVMFLNLVCNILGLIIPTTLILGILSLKKKAAGVLKCGRTETQNSPSLN
uniref:Taste receptor type 2 n=1 Tax=Erpetoichthys calabaricus TaxID=27687 RepID=A0A8C4S1N3_ERPCA